MVASDRRANTDLHRQARSLSPGAPTSKCSRLQQWSMLERRVTCGSPIVRLGIAVQTCLAACYDARVLPPVAQEKRRSQYPLPISDLQPLTHAPFEMVAHLAASVPAGSEPWNDRVRSGASAGSKMSTLRRDSSKVRVCSIRAVERSVRTLWSEHPQDRRPRRCGATLPEWSPHAPSRRSDETRNVRRARGFAVLVRARSIPVEHCAAHRFRVVCRHSWRHR